jgi:hypothetical protein
LSDYDGGTPFTQFGTDDAEPDYTTPLGKVRLLTADLDWASPLLSDGLLDGYLGLHSGNPYRAAADALDAMATSEVLLARKIRTQDLSTDGPAVAAELRKQAAVLRAKADADDLAAAGSVFELVPLQDGFHPEAAEWPRGWL